MVSFPLAHKIKKPFEYIDAAHTDIRVRFEKVRSQQQKDRDGRQPNVLPIREAANHGN